MTIAKKIRELVDALVAAGGWSSESLERLDLRGYLDQVQLAGWSHVLKALPVAGIHSVTAIDSLGEPVDLISGGTDLMKQELRILIAKSVNARTAFCITTDGVRALFADLEAPYLVKQVWVTGEFSAFHTESCRVDPWVENSEEVSVLEIEDRAPDPRRLVKEFGSKRVPKSVLPYLLSSDAPTPSPVFDQWKNLATVRLLHSLVNEVLSTDREQVVITGTRPRKVDSDLTAPIPDKLFKSVTDSARWIYASGRDVDTRFALFTYELSREWPDALALIEGFSERGELALEAAQTAFRAHVQETSKDTLKSLGDLRKTLSEEVAKVVSQTRDLLATMWRDFLVATTALLGRVVLLGADKPLNSTGPLTALLTGAAVFLIFSLFLSLRTNWKFMTIADDSRKEWRRKLYGFLNDEDFKKLSDEPLTEAALEYSRIVRAVIFAYLLVIVCLLWNAWGGDSNSSLGGQNITQRSTAGTISKPSLTQAYASHPAHATSAPVPTHTFPPAHP